MKDDADVDENVEDDDAMPFPIVQAAPIIIPPESELNELVSSKLNEKKKKINQNKKLFFKLNLKKKSKRVRKV